MKNPELMILSEEYAEKLKKTHDDAAAEILDPQRRMSNVVGLADGIKWTDGNPTGEPSYVVLVNQKVSKNELNKNDLIPKQLQGIPTDVLTVGDLYAGTTVIEAPKSRTIKSNGSKSYPSWIEDFVDNVVERPGFSTEFAPQLLTQKVRPARGGYSVGHPRVTAGTLGTVVFDLMNGQGVGPRYYILSNNHVLADCNNASINDPILQPGVADGGTLSNSQIAKLSRFIPINFRGGDNLVDAALAEGNFHELDRSIYWIGYLGGWCPKARVRVGTLVEKTGRTTNFTTGRITGINATVNVNYSNGRIARFCDQIVTTPMSAGGDSGSIVCTRPGSGYNQPLTANLPLALGLLFAGSSAATVCNQMENVVRLLRIELA